MSNYGYPTCCIEWFNQRFINKTFDMTYLQCKYTKHGFIPCCLCAQKLESNNMQLNELICKDQRTVKTDFPITRANTEDEMKYLLINTYSTVSFEEIKTKYEKNKILKFEFNPKR